MTQPPPPNTHELLPPLLACLPASFVSPQPPPALLPLLSPLLRQRLTYLQNQHSSHRYGWLPLLSWDSETSSRLPGVVEHIQIEPHPVSGEIEIEDVQAVTYRRLDQETLQARLELEQFNLLPTYVWCQNDEHGQTGPGWKLADLKPLEDFDDRSDWYDSVSAANDAMKTSDSRNQNGGPNGVSAANSLSNGADDEDDYWAAYDQMSSRTPRENGSPAPQPRTGTASRERTQSDVEYFARYGDVQPAMDAHDPDEASSASIAEQSSLQGNTLIHTQNPRPSDRMQTTNHTHEESGSGPQIAMPRAISPPSSRGSSVDQIEQAAAAGQTIESDDRAHIGIKQHISTDIKSLYRLAKSVGISRDEFTDLIHRELEVLSIFDRDD